jgi:alpha-glucosidase
MTLVAGTRVATLLDEPHHDGSDAYVLERPSELGDGATVRVRVPRASAADRVLLRFVRDGEAQLVDALVDEEDERETWWRATFPVAMPATRYRWLVGDAWVNGLGRQTKDVPDADDFVLSLDRGGADWHLGSVVYEIFPDRFATSGLDVDAPAWAVRRAWDARPTGRGRATPVELFGGDLLGVERRLDHLEELGASIIYLTPIFPAGSTHRYDATTFDRIDPLLGGEEALASLLDAAHARGIRVVGDLTPNHVGEGHEWFQAALADDSAPERGFFWFDERVRHGYASWMGVKALPKLDWRSPELERRMLAVVRRWLDFGLDGWRIDVANMTGRHGDVDVNHDVARALRGAAGDALLVAEHFHDFRPDLQGGGWHGVMNYMGFMRPVWSWLAAPDAKLPTEVVAARRNGTAAVEAMRTFRAGVPWPGVLHSWTLLDSHDVARFRTIAGSRDRHVVGVGLQMTSPGVPMVFAGDEIGLEGAWGEDARRTMPWDDRGTWDATLFAEYRALIALRRSSDALASGGMRYAFVGDDAIAYLRETHDERLLCLASRGPHSPVRLSLDALACRSLEPVYGAPAVVGGEDVLLPAEGPSFHVWRLNG